MSLDAETLMVPRTSDSTSSAGEALADGRASPPIRSTLSLLGVMKPSALTGRRPLFRRLASAGLVLSLLVAGCGSDGEGEASTTTTTTAAPKTEATDAEATTTSTSSVASTTAAPDTTTTEGDAIEIVVEGGEVVSGTETIQVELGSTVRFVVTSDTADHVHIHGYDLFYDIAPDSRTEVSFTADVPGIFEIELENSHLLLVELEVS